MYRALYILFFIILHHTAFSQILNGVVIDHNKESLPGASISVNGVCLTVVSLENNLVEFDVISESLKRSNLGSLKIGDFVNVKIHDCTSATLIGEII